ncbi:four helix bundle protein [candidate division KSB1 bacterium]|nr:four helix bundle protein [candidate division KSB1 bacterium]
MSDSGEIYNANKDFVTLNAWKKAREVKLFFYNKIIPKLPREEKFNLDTQIRKVAVSITANISEGYGRYNYQERIQFYRISRASLYELKDHLISCYDLEYIDRGLIEEGKELIEEAKRMLNGYITYVKSKKK